MGFWSFFSNLFGDKKVGASAKASSTNSHKFYALLTGINQYQMPGNNLNGCVEDAKDIGSCLQNDFNFDEIKYLFNSDATKKNIVDNLTATIAKAVSGDTVVYYHSGHGTKIPDLDGDEKDGYDECFVNYDFDFDDRNLQLVDDDFAEVIKNVKDGVQLIVIVDTCHSGTITREFSVNTTKKRFIPFPSKPESVHKINKLFKKDIFKNQPYLLLSACTDSQTSEEVEMGDTVRGVFTFYFVKLLKINKTKTWKEIYDLVCREVKKNGYDQTPQFNGDLFANKKPFSGE